MLPKMTTTKQRPITNDAALSPARVQQAEEFLSWAWQTGHKRLVNRVRQGTLGDAGMARLRCVLKLYGWAKAGKE